MRADDRLDDEPKFVTGIGARRSMARLDRLTQGSASDSEALLGLCFGPEQDAETALAGAQDVLTKVCMPIRLLRWLRTLDRDPMMIGDSECTHFTTRV